MCVLSCSVTSDSVVPWTVACQAPLSIEFSRQEYWSRLPFPSPRIFLTQGSNPCLLHLLHWQVDSLPLSPSVKPHNSFTAMVPLHQVNCINTNNIVYSDHGACHLSRRILLQSFLNISVFNALKTITLYTPRDEEREKIFYLSLCLNVIFLLWLILTILIKTANLHSTLSNLSWSISSIVLIAFWYIIYLTIFIVHCMFLPVRIQAAQRQIFFSFPSS